MDYYGYFQTFNFLVVEVQLVATLIGLEAIFFIFWYKEKHQRMIRNSKKEYKKKDKTLLVFGTIFFIWIIFFGTIFLTSSTTALYDHPIVIENLISQGKEIPDSFKNELNFLHSLFLFWIFISSIYIVILILSLDIFSFFKISISIKKKNTKQTEKKEKKDKKRDEKNNKKTIGGK